jgi:hypothetical protein
VGADKPPVLRFRSIMIGLILPMELNSQSSQLHARLALCAILVVFVLAGFIYSISTPFLDVSDEVRHYAMVEQLAQGKGLPIQDPAHHGFYEQEGSQPPLYYGLMALIALAFDRSDFMALAQFNPHARLGRADTTSNWNQLIHGNTEQFPWHGTVLVVQILRFCGILIGALTVLCTYTLAKQLIDSDSDTPYHRGARYVPLLAATLTAFNPMFVFISASVNNDNLAALLSSLGLLLGAWIIRHGLTWRNSITLGIVLGCDAISKSSALALVVMIPLAILVSEWFRRYRQTTSAPTNIRQVLRLVLPAARQLAVSLLLVAVIAGWWYVRNAYYYNGDFTGTTMMATIAGARQVLPSLAEIVGEWAGFRQAYWGLFGAVNIPMAQWIYSGFDVLLILAGFGLVGLVCDCIPALRTTLRANHSQQRLGITIHPALLREREIAALMCFGTFLVAFAALVRWTSLTLASQGRLLFPVIAVISTFISLGLWRLAVLVSNRVKARPIEQGVHTLIGFASYALMLALIGLTLISPFAYIRPAYATPATIASENLLPADMIKSELRFEDSIRWLGYRVETGRVQPGDEFIVTLYWQGLKPMDTNYSAFIRLYGRDDTEAFLLDTYPGGGMWQTTRWQVGDIVADRYRLRIADTITNAELMPGTLWLDVGFWNFETKQFLNTFDLSGKPTGRQRYAAGALASRNPVELPAAPEPYLSQAKPAESIVAQNGNHLTLTITWTVTADFSEDYTIFVHLFNASGVKLAQADGPAANNTFSSRWWRKGDTVVDPHTFELPAGMPAGDYTIKYGLYRPSDGARMPAFTSDGQPIGDAALTQPVTIK